MKKLFYLFLLLCVVSSCSEDSSEETNRVALKEPKAIEKSAKKDTPVDVNKSDSQLTKEIRVSKENLVCKDIKIENKKVLQEQTFPFDTKPFEGTCFVTTHDPDYNDPPRALELSLYKDGKQIYTFDSRFNPESVNCRIEAVSFEDLNKDGLKDVIFVGKCEAKSGEILANEVHMNTGKKTFHTNTAANDKLESFKKVKEVSDFVKKNKELFFK